MRENDDFDVHPASEEERLAIYRNVHDVWSGGRSMEEHLARRLVSPSHRRAEWFAGVLEGRVVASLGCQPLEFWVHGAAVDGFAICSVHTVAEMRGQGLAPKLITEVERIQCERGRRLSLLYSDIGHGYYERLGYSAGRSCTGTYEVSKMAAGGNAREVDAEAYRAATEPLAARRAISITRSPSYWQHLGEREPRRRCWLVDGTNGPAGGFVLAPRAEDAWNVLEIQAADDDAATEATVDQLTRTAHELGAVRLTGWMPDVAAVRSSFELSPREEELTMLKALDRAVDVDEAVLAATDWFHEADHV